MFLTLIYQWLMNSSRRVAPLPMVVALLAACEPGTRANGAEREPVEEAATAAPAEPHGEVLLRADLPTSPTARAPLPEFGEDEYTPRREAMVAYQIRDRGITETRVLEAMRRVPRHLFVPTAERARAYADHPIPIGHGQTISQPSIVALMTELLAVEEDHHVLEIGTGSAYQGAILAELAREVSTIEIIGALARSSADRYRELGYRNVNVMHGDGYFGWSEDSRFDGIMVTAAAEHVPPPLIAQLKPGGRMVIPVGQTAWSQNLLLVEKREDGSVRTRNILPVRFVPLTRGER